MYASTAQTAEPICTHNSSNYAVCCKEVPFGGRVDTKLYLGVKNPRKPQILETGCQISSQINIHEQLLNGIRDRRKISIDSLYKIGVGESNGDIIFALGRHLAAKTTSGPILKL